MSPEVGFGAQRAASSSRRPDDASRVAPHSTTPFDLGQTIGSAVLVVALCLLLVRLLPGPAGPGGRRRVCLVWPPPISFAKPFKTS